MTSAFALFLGLLGLLVLAALRAVRRRLRRAPRPAARFIGVVRADRIRGHRPVGAATVLRSVTESRDEAVADLRRQAEALGSNVVLSLRYEFEPVTDRCAERLNSARIDARAKTVKVWTGTAATLETPEDAGAAVLDAIRRGDKFVIDGSNVMHWNGGQPGVDAIVQVVKTLRRRRATVHVFFDASAGHRLIGRYADATAFARALKLRRRDVTVVNRGTVADRPILERARSLRTTVVTCDLYRDHADLASGAVLLAGGIEDGKVLFRRPVAWAEVARSSGHTIQRSTQATG